MADLVSGSIFSVPRITQRRRDLAEVLLVYGAILAVIWTPNPAQRILYWFACAIIVGILALRRPTLDSLGLVGRNLGASLWILTAALLLGATSIWVAYRLHTLHSLFGQARLFSHVWGYFVWAFLQQFLLQVVILSRMIRLTSRAKAIVIVGLMFAAAHIPSPLLATACLAWGICSCALYLRYRNLYVLGLAHGILGLCFAITVPDHIHHHMRVGIGYLTYRPHTNLQRHTHGT